MQPPDTDGRALALYTVHAVFGDATIVLEIQAATHFSARMRAERLIWDSRREPYRAVLAIRIAAVH